MNEIWLVFGVNVNIGEDKNCKHNLVTPQFFEPNKGFKVFYIVYISPGNWVS